MTRIAITIALLLAACEVGDDRAAEVLASEGLHRPTWNGPSPFSCHDGDDFSESFVAYRTDLNPDGSTRETRVEGVICCGFFTCLVRR